MWHFVGAAPRATWLGVPQMKYLPLLIGMYRRRENPLLQPSREREKERDAVNNEARLHFKNGQIPSRLRRGHKKRG